MQRGGWVLLGVVAVLAACGGDDGATSTSGTGAGAAGAGGSGAGGSGAGGSGTGGMGAGGGTGGSGGMAFVDPLEGIGAVTLISGGHTFSEGTAWFPDQQLLYFSDIPDDEIFAVAADGTVTPWTTMSAGTNGNGLDVDGSMISCEQGNRRLVRRSDFNTPTSVEVIVDAYQGMALNRPNDVIVRSDGQLYFTDPNYGTPNQELPFQGVFWVDPSNGNAITLIDDVMDKPNGIGLSPDETVLYVTDAAQDELWAFDVNADGSIVDGSKTKLADTSSTPDGFAVDDQGYLYLTTAAGIDVHAPDGSLFGNIPVPEQPANCAFGGSDRRTLYITARTGLYEVVVNVPGKP